MRQLFLVFFCFFFTACVNYSPPLLETASITYYVSTTGDDTTGLGTQNKPWRTIQEAADTAVAGDTVNVLGGVYNERVTFKKSGIAGSYITFQSYPGETAIIDGTGLAVPDGDNALLFIRSVTRHRISASLLIGGVIKETSP